MPSRVQFVLSEGVSRQGGCFPQNGRRPRNGVLSQERGEFGGDPGMFLRQKDGIYKSDRGQPCREVGGFNPELRREAGQIGRESFRLFA